MQLVIISGPPNAGKSAAAEALCFRYDRMLHIDVAAMREFLRMGRLRDWDDSAEARLQHDLFAASATDMARRFLDAGYGVVIEGVITQDDLPAYRVGLAGCAEPVHFGVLLPKLEQLLVEQPRLTSRVRELHAQFASWEGVAVVDPGNLAPELVADRVMALAAQGSALLSNVGQ